MSLDEKFIPIRTFFYQMVNNLVKKTAGFFGYPENPGMPTVYHNPNEPYSQAEFLDKLPLHETNWPPRQQPETWFETIFGPAPKVDAVLRTPFENKEEGFANFYIPNYKNIYFLPDWLSEFLQVRLNLCSDITLLETIREVLFVGLVVYSQIVILRIALSWFIYINPYSFPWCYVAAAVDWTEDILQGVVPAILGVNITGSVFLGILGVMADSLNHLVFTMPYLPSEGEETKLLLNQETKDVVMFHYLPILWYRYPIPNDIREFWYNDRPDILNYMEKAYQDLDIQFLPDSVIQQFNQQKLKADLSQINSSFIEKKSYLGEISSTQALSNNDLIQGDQMISYFNSMNDHFHNIWMNHFDKFL